MKWAEFMFIWSLWMQTIQSSILSCSNCLCIMPFDLCMIATTAVFDLCLTGQFSGVTPVWTGSDHPKVDFALDCDIWQIYVLKDKRVKGLYSSSWDESHHRVTGRHLLRGITQCYLTLNTSEHAPPKPQPVSWYSIYLPRRDGRLSWPRLPGNAPARSRTRDLSITSPTP